jgi:beta-glucanase (GH16 family)
MKSTITSVLVVALMTTTGCASLGNKHTPEDVGGTVDDPFDNLDESFWFKGDWVLRNTQLVPGLASVKDGMLRLAHEQGDAGTWRGAEIYSAKAYLFGTWSASLKAPSEPGTVCSFFLWGKTESGKVMEIDFEMLSSRPNMVQVSTFSNWVQADEYGDGPTHRSIWWTGPSSFSIDEMHTYTFEWTREAVTFRIDDKEIARIDDVVPNGAANIRFNHWTSKDWPEVGYPPHSNSVCLIDRVWGRLSNGNGGS